ncbi:tautomerase family protein [Singulisphaera sp. Ch08]|uniref:Tautomerase family protein n=1 Tax=Singulisphaera sp. Ch08 TaxID=3120278 RepID=A0AAU7CJ07_9BACT
MPLYSIMTQSGTLDGSQKANLAAEITTLHVELSGVPRNWVHVIFQDYAPGSGFIAGEVGPTVSLTLSIRTGRTADYQHNLLTRLWALLQKATTAIDDQIVIGIQEVPPVHAMEMGQVMPDVAPNVQ